MRKTTTLALCAALAALPACAGDEVHIEDQTADVVEDFTAAEDVPCRCGEAEADLLGCACQACSSGAGNPDNELCTCGAIAIVPTDGDGQTQTVSLSEDGKLQAGTKGAPPVILLRDGRKLRGHVVKELDDGIQVQIVTAGTIAVTKVLYSNLHPRTLYRLKLGKLQKDDAAGHLDVADFAADHEMWDAARLHYLEAAELDERLASDIDAKLLALLERAADNELARGTQAMNDGSNAAAKRHFHRVLRDFPESNAAEDARGNLAAIAEQESGIAPGGFDGLDAKQTEQLQKAHEQLGGSARASRTASARRAVPSRSASSSRPSPAASGCGRASAGWTTRR